MDVVDAGQIRARAADLAAVLSGYAVTPVSGAHVYRWLDQFPTGARKPLLAALVPVLRRGYYPAERIGRVVRALAGRSLAEGRTARGFWSSVRALQLGVPGHSQEVLHKMLCREVGRRHSIALDTGAREGEEFVVFDDFLFSGTCIVETLRDWLHDPAVRQRRVHLVFLALHTYGLARAHRELTRAAAEAGKEVDLVWWHDQRIEDAPGAATADVLRPGPVCPPSVIFPAPALAVLAEALLPAGLRIMERIADPPFYLRPLGFQGIPSEGFGTLLSTYRGCPNHAPLALWFGDPSGQAEPPWDAWYPLMPRPMPRQRLELRGLPERFFAYDPELAALGAPPSHPL